MRAARLLFVSAIAFAQSFTQRGFLETNAWLYPQGVPGDSSLTVGVGLLRYEASWKATPGWSFAGALDARTDSHRQVDRTAAVSWWDRGARRPALGVRRLSAAYRRGKLTAEFGKQFVRWGKADLLNPTDRFAPRDYLNVVETDFLGITAARLTYGGQSNTLDVVWSPRLTPSRTPLLGMRWAPLPGDFRLEDRGARIPGGSQIGARWNHIGRLAEYSLSFYQGFNHLPLIEGTLLRPRPLTVGLERRYAQLRSFGADIAWPLRWLTVKAESAYFTSSTAAADDYVLYVVQLERQAGEWFFVGGYGGESVTHKRRLLDFAPDRGLARAFLGRAGYNIDANRSVAFDTAVRQNGHGFWSRAEYSQAIGKHWRVTAGFAVIRGRADDFLGQYRRNSHFSVVWRYSF